MEGNMQMESYQPTTRLSRIRCPINFTLYPTFDDNICCLQTTSRQEYVRLLKVNILHLTGAEVETRHCGVISRRLIIWTH